MDIDFAPAKGMMTGKVDEEMKEEGAGVNINNLAKEDRSGNHSPCNSNPA